jgi:hypothetical protein
MKKNKINSLLLSALTSFFIVSCSSDDSSSSETEPQPDTARWITVAGSVMGTTPGDGNGGTIVYSLTKDQAKNPEFQATVFDNGFQVKSQRTARLQSSVDGSNLFNIQYTGTDGGQVDKYLVSGAGNFIPTSGANISQYVGTSPRWGKLFDGDKTGIAVNVTTPRPNNYDSSTSTVNPNIPYAYTVGKSTVLSFGLQTLAINGYKTYELRLSETEEAQGYHIFRLDAPVLNKVGNKLLVGVWMGKTDPITGNSDASAYTRLGSKTLVLDYPSLENPVIITSTQGHGDTTGFRSLNSFLSESGAIYQATQRDPNGSKILKITENNQYDNSYVLSLDDALGIEGAYIDSWRYVGNGIAYALYTHDNANNQGFVARLDLNAKTATKVDLPYKAGVDFGQYQGFVVDGKDLYITLAPIGENGNIYIINSETNVVTKGATLVNKAGNNFIGVF